MSIITRIFSPRARIVKKGDQVTGSGAAEFGAPQRVRFHLANWASWMRIHEEVQGFPDKTPGTINWSIRSDTEGMAMSIDLHNAELVDMIIRDDLTTPENAAIHHHYGLVRTFPSGNLPDLLESAKVKIGASLTRRGIY